ncbi:MAG: phosphodiester glycosidase family protein [Pseudomonadota bacterium]
MLSIILVASIVVFVSASYASPQNTTSTDQARIWHDIDKGLSMATFDLTTTPRQGTPTKPRSLPSKNPALVAIRIDPNLWQFSVHCASNNNNKALSIRQWAEQEDLTVAINASMYLPDKLTSTGYLRAHEHINNGHIGSKLGAFFVAEPYQENASNPIATLIDKPSQPYESLMQHYSMVVQNFRLISPDRRILWDAGGARHSIAAIGQDAQGHILFLHSVKPMTPHEFAAVLLAFPLQIRNTMYVEGGPEAALLLRSPDTSHVWIGKLRPELLGSGNSNVPLPNIIGVRRR